MRTDDLIKELQRFPPESEVQIELILNVKQSLYLDDACVDIERVNQSQGCPLIVEIVK